MSRRKIGLIITAAGLSSRMHAFKPLLMLGDKTMIEHMLDNAEIGEIDSVVVVVGREKEKMTAFLAARGVSVVYNENYRNNDMLESIKCGLRTLGPVDCFLVVPVDMPLIPKACYHSILEKRSTLPECPVIKITYEGKGGHPILVDGKCIPDILAYQGDQGLKGVLKKYADQMEILEWKDAAVVMDADTQEDFERIKTVYEREALQARKPMKSIHGRLPDREELESLYRRYETPEAVIRHMRKVAKICGRLLEEYPGREDWKELVEKAALTHDLCRTRKDHAAVGAQVLREEGYEVLAPLVAEHHSAQFCEEGPLTPSELLFYGDKLALEDREVTLQERFSASATKCHTPEAKAKHAALYHKALAIEKKLQKEQW